MMQVQGDYLDGAIGNPTQVLGAIAAGISAINVAGGFAVTFRMLAMFKKSSPAEPAAAKTKKGEGAESDPKPASAQSLSATKRPENLVVSTVTVSQV